MSDDIRKDLKHRIKVLSTEVRRLERALACLEADDNKPKRKRGRPAKMKDNGADIPQLEYDASNV